jgi:ATP-dependent Zn protease
VERGELADQVRQAVNAILQEQLDLATKLLEENRDKLDRMVQTLLQKNHLNGKQIDEIFNQ